MLVTQTFAQFCATTRHMASWDWLECVRGHVLSFPGTKQRIHFMRKETPTRKTRKYEVPTRPPVFCLPQNPFSNEMK